MVRIIQTIRTAMHYCMVYFVILLLILTFISVATSTYSGIVKTSIKSIPKEINGKSIYDVEALYGSGFVLTDLKWDKAYRVGTDGLLWYSLMVDYSEKGIVVDSSLITEAL